MTPRLVSLSSCWGPEIAGPVFFLHNGRSVATASHFANDMAIVTRCMAKPFHALSLTDKVSEAIPLPACHNALLWALLL